jgi:transcriptional regulator of arginine metabolism
MKERQTRHSAIRKILETDHITSQEQLKTRLEERGFSTTQATLSRDLVTLKVIRLPDAQKGHIYALPNQAFSASPMLDNHAPLKTCQSIAFSGNLAVIKCLPSFAPSVALILDSLNLDAIIGTVAGDDTVLVVIREDISHARIRERLLERLPELRDRF